MRIIIGIDGSPQAMVGVRWVSHLPLSSRDDVLLVSVVDAPVMIGAWGYTDADVNSRAIDRARNAAARATRRITERTLAELRALACPVHTVELEGHPVEALEQGVRDVGADLLVIGPHGRGRLESILLGSVSHSLLRTMPTSVLIAREPVGAPRRVLLASDGSWSGSAATKYVAGFPMAPDATVDIITVTGDRSRRFQRGQVGDGGIVGAVQLRHVAAALDDAMDALGAAGRAGNSISREGDPTRTILTVARERQSDLIVMGTRWDAGLRGRIQGSVSCAVSTAAACSTLVVAPSRERIVGIHSSSRPLALDSAS